MDDIHSASTIYLAVVNLVAIFAFGWDKLCAAHGWRRTPEKILLLLAVFGGSVGAMAGMCSFTTRLCILNFVLGCR